METKEIIEILEKQHMEYQMVSILMFNEIGFSFIPLSSIRLDIHEGNTVSILGYDDINLMSTDYQIPSFEMPESILLMKGFNHYLRRPEHLHAYISLHNNELFGEIIHDRGSAGIRNVRNQAFEYFLERASISSLDEVYRLFEKSNRIRQKKYAQGKTRKKSISSTEALFDSHLLKSISLMGENLDELKAYFSIRLFVAENEIFDGKYNAIDLQFCVDGDEYVKHLSFYEKFVPILPTKTSLEKPFSIIDSNDTIANLLYNIAVNIKPNVFLVATGYAFESGLNMLLPICQNVHSNKPERIEFIVGDLQKYKEGIKQKSPNRATITKLNWMKQSHMLQKLYTLSDNFYHGKFYYISNGNLSYIIIGSSNVTETAYTRNNELDVIYRVEKNTPNEELDQAFLLWYENLKDRCVLLPYLDETLFPSNLKADETGNSSGDSFFRTLTTEEEQNRYNIWVSFNPSTIDYQIFKKRKEYRNFKNYVVFTYPEYGLIVVESFVYGNSSYIFKLNNTDELKKVLAYKGRQQIQDESEYLVACLRHSDTYEQDIQRVFDVNR